MQWSERKGVLCLIRGLLVEIPLWARTVQLLLLLFFIFHMKYFVKRIFLNLLLIDLYNNEFIVSI